MRSHDFRQPLKKVYRTAKERVPYETHGIRISSITEPMIDIFWSILLYYNGEEVQKEVWPPILADTWQLAQNRPPSIQELLDCSDELWEERYASPFEELQESGLVDSSYILQKRIEWDPKPPAIALMGQLFGGVYTECYQAARPEEAPVYGEQNESLMHRLGVELTCEVCQQRGGETTRYPGQLNTARPDLRMTKRFDGEVVPHHFEVLTDHNNRDMLDRKCELMRQLDGKHLWLFESRQHATRVLNYWYDTSSLDLVNAPYSNAGNHSISKLNEYISRSKRNDDFNCGFIDEVLTIPQIYDLLHNQLS